MKTLQVFPLLALAMLCVAQAPALDPKARQSLQQGIQAYEAKDFEAAEQEFEGARAADGDALAPRVNLGLARARQGKHDAASEAFENALSRGDLTPEERALAAYNLGRSRFDEATAMLAPPAPPQPAPGQAAPAPSAAQQAPDPETLVKALETAIESLDAFNQAAQLAPEDEQALHNRAQAQHLIRQIAEQLQLQQQQPQPQPQEQQEQQQQQQQQDQRQEQEQQQQEQENQQQQQNPDQQQQGEQESPQQQNQQQEGQPQDQQQNQQQGQPQQPQQQPQEQGEPQDQQSPQQPDESDQQQPQDGQQGGKPQEPAEGMTEEEARELLNLLGNRDMVRDLTLPPQSGGDPNRKEW